MTTPSLDTVLTVTVSEHTLKPARCEVGKDLLRQWRLEYDAYTKEHPGHHAFYRVLGRGYLPYARHASNCEECLRYEYRMFGIKEGKQDETRTGN